MEAVLNQTSMRSRALAVGILPSRQRGEVEFVLDKTSGGAGATLKVLSGVNSSDNRRLRRFSVPTRHSLAAATKDYVRK